MKIVEFRIFMPFQLPWCRAASKYAVNRRTTEESGGGDGFEIVEADNFEENGQVGRHVHRILHFKNQVPAAIRWAVPEKYSSIHEDNRNCFPHYQANFFIPNLGDDLIFDTETKHFEYEKGTPLEEFLENTLNNVMGFSQKELKKRQIVYLDILDGKESKNKQFDIHGYSFEEGGIPPFPTKKSHSDSSKPPHWLKGYDGPLVCIVKTVKFRLKFHGIQSFVEKYVTQTIMPQTYLDTHRSMLIWINEWFHMSEEDLMNLENKTKDSLAQNTYE
ncbi:Phosphatidylinositol transfer protein [Histomonas meleagridis]|uniref:Phosphatidylinositol transfer protein n=1 Tax=Histomonas meleagridis TaxID=135588 RepID=UPI00355AAD18|nr:Phosphatidylinositol transfer protein [Histomonas meleagridis]KAH0805428.1 Phosphatidylinositol transfer protein [Histomonas meleagridis]